MNNYNKEIGKLAKGLSSKRSSQTTTMQKVFFFIAWLLYLCFALKGRLCFAFFTTFIFVPLTGYLA
jgi:hypothetical protein